jgi:hypothetical protein
MHSIHCRERANFSELASQTNSHQVRLADSKTIELEIA